MTNESKTGYEGDPIRSPLITSINFSAETLNLSRAIEVSTPITKSLMRNGCCHVGDLEELNISKDNKEITFKGETLKRGRLSVETITAIKDTRDRIFGTQAQKLEMEGFAASDFELVADPEIKEDALEVTYKIPPAFTNVVLDHRGNRSYNDDDIGEEISDALGGASVEFLFDDTDGVTLRLAFSEAANLRSIFDGTLSQRLASAVSEVRDNAVASILKRYGAKLS